MYIYTLSDFSWGRVERKQGRGWNYMESPSIFLYSIYIYLYVPPCAQWLQMTASKAPASLLILWTNSSSLYHSCNMTHDNRRTHVFAAGNGGLVLRKEKSLLRCPHFREDVLLT